MAEENRDMYAYLDRLSTRRLEELLLADAEDTSGRDTSEIVFHILEVLQTREDNPIEDTLDADRAWEEFQKYYNTPEGRGQSLYPCEEDKKEPRPEKVAPAAHSKSRFPVRWKTIGVVAATIALSFALMVGAQASGLDIFGALARWSDEIFHWGPATSTIQSEYYDEFLAALEEYDIQPGIAPTRVPDGFEASKPTIWSDELGTCIQLPFYNSDGKDFIFSVEHYVVPQDVEQRDFEKDITSVESYIQGNKTFYILSNLDFVMATWTDGTLSESIWGTLSLDEVKMIIDSIKE